MKITPFRTLVVVSLVGLITFGGAWWRSSYVLGQRFRAFQRSADAISYVQGGRLPVRADVERQVANFAVDNQLQLSNLNLVIHDEADAENGRRRIYEVTGTAQSQALILTRRAPLHVRIALNR